MDINELINSCLKPYQSSPVDEKEAADNADWVKKIIHSCYTKYHFESVQKMIDLYKERYGKTPLWEELCVEYKARLAHVFS